MSLQLLTTLKNPPLPLHDLSEIQVVDLHDLSEIQVVDEMAKNQGTTKHMQHQYEIHDDVKVAITHKESQMHINVKKYMS